MAPCALVTPLRTPSGDVNGISREVCEADVRKGRTAGGASYAETLMAFALGYTDDNVIRVYADHMETNRSFDFLGSRRQTDDVKVWSDMDARIRRVPDFSDGDDLARKRPRRR